MHDLVKRHISEQPFKEAIFLLDITQALRFVHLHAIALGLSTAETLLRDPVLAHEIRSLSTGLEDAGDLIFLEPHLIYLLTPHLRT